MIIEHVNDDYHIHKHAQCHLDQHAESVMTEATSRGPQLRISPSSSQV